MSHNAAKPGRSIAGRELVSVSGARIPIPDTRRLIHLQFRRFAGCPVCDLHLHSFSRRHGEIEAANIREVVVFHSSAEQLAKYAKDLPFALVPDPDTKMYKEFGVDTSLRALLDPRVWVFIVAGISHSLFKIVARRHAVPTLTPEGGRLGRPADFLIATNGTILASKHGEHAYDQWSVDDLLCLARSSATTTCDDRDPSATHSAIRAGRGTILMPTATLCSKAQSRASESRISPRLFLTCRTLCSLSATCHISAHTLAGERSVEL